MLGEPHSARLLTQRALRAEKDRLTYAHDAPSACIVEMSQLWDGVPGPGLSNDRRWPGARAKASSTFWPR